jgi:hypothetical protein
MNRDIRWKQRFENYFDQAVRDMAGRYLAAFDVQAYEAIRHRPLREHIDRVGRRFYARAEGGAKV